MTITTSKSSRLLVTSVRAALALLASLLVWSAAYAAGGYGGYKFNCSTICDGVRFTYIEPVGTYTGTNGEVSNVATIWAGLQGNANRGSGCSNPLIQFGTEPIAFPAAPTTHTTWYEEFPCNGITSWAGPTINGGDTVFVQLLCTSSSTTCGTGDSTDVWQMTMTNVTTNTTVQRTDTGYTVYGDNAWAVVEISSAGTNSAGFQPLIFPPIKFIHAEVHQSGTWNPMTLSARLSQTGFEQVSTTPSNQMAKYSASAPLGVSLNDFFVCSAMQNTTSSLPALICPAAQYSGGGIGP